eukprot:Blabericola_migrator_1__5200@NODE_267_length_10594_cov_56_602451_g223_i0_p7_GENE_NODE_267_length_10594_cov_56_602451_g223_i0NODE_267_length_10594_cov_56_602451_g223_i0_p7_ORF_typecomplete_len156_score26_03PSI/PF01437_25/0_02PSI/PF01437_25/6_5zfUBP_var/PF17807_1/0_45zfUBP_var/PF17807_1/4_4e02zfUBP_var/PF17807_1/6_9e02PSI_integrin/PF17205_3/2_1e02PSI_integrin/PF17205_3/0_21_NODE_267_length_10594_cov_56_602451_g223_i087419208
MTVVQDGLARLLKNLRDRIYDLEDEEAAVVDGICATLVMQEDCSYCIAHEYNANGLCGWCQINNACVALYRKSECLALAESIENPPDNPWVAGEAGLDLCPPQESELEWGRFSCLASDNQDCFVCLNDAACAWCLNPIEGLGVGSERLQYGQTGG